MHAFWNISAPFVYRVELDTRSESRRSAGRFPLSGPAVIQILERILPTALEIYIEGEEPAAHPDILDILRFLDDSGTAYHLQYTGLSGKPRTLLHNLRELCHLSSLRIVYPANRASKTAVASETLKIAVASGLKVWSVTPLVAETVRHLEDILLAAHRMGVKAMVVTRTQDSLLSEGGELQAAFLKAAELRDRGFPVIMEDCAPVGATCPLIARCRGGLGSAHLDALGQLRACPHGQPLGSLMEKPVEALWRDATLTRWRESALARVSPVVAGDFYRRGCGFGVGAATEANRGGDCAADDTSASRVEDPAALDPDLCPIPHYILRPEEFGGILIKVPEFLPVSMSGRAIAEALDGTRRLRDIRSEFGPEALSFVCALFGLGMVRLGRRVV